MENETTNQTKKTNEYLLLIIFLCFLISLGLLLIPQLSNRLNLSGPTPAPISAPPAIAAFTVIRVLDGDTIELEDGRRVRYIGINAPEKDQCFGEKAVQANKELALGKQVRLETDVQQFDKYGRTLAYVFVRNKLINEELVRTGFVKTATYPPNVKYQQRFRQAEDTARKNQKGLWMPDACL